MNTIQVSDVLAQQLNGLLTVIKAANFSGSLEGLFAYHILEGEASFPLDWAVNNAQPVWLEEHKHELEYFPTIASLGYSLYHWQKTTSEVVRETFQSGLRKLEQRELFPDDGYSFINIPTTFLGVVLGSLATFSKEEGQGVLSWLRQALQLKRQKGILDLYQDLIYTYAKVHLDDVPAVINIPKKCTQLEALALLEWGFRRGAFQLSGIYQDVAKVQDELLQLMLISPINFSEADIAAVVWSAVRSCLVSQLQASSQPQQDPFLDLKAGLEQVRNEVALLPPDIRVEFATLEMRLLSSLDEENRFGVNEVVRSERTRVLEALNKFCIRSLNKTFSRFCYP